MNNENKKNLYLLQREFFLLQQLFFKLLLLMAEMTSCFSLCYILVEEASHLSHFVVSTECHVDSGHCCCDCSFACEAFFFLQLGPGASEQSPGKASLRHQFVRFP